MTTEEEIKKRLEQIQQTRDTSMRVTMQCYLEDTEFLLSVIAYWRKQAEQWRELSLELRSEAGNHLKRLKELSLYLKEG